MIQGIEGIPGSGKSYEAVTFHILPALRRGRKVITNLPLNTEQIFAVNPDYLNLLEIRRFPQRIYGDWDADAAGRGEYAFVVRGNGQSEAPLEDATVFGTVWDYYDTWRDAEGKGALFVIDECHVALPKLGTDKQVIQWFKLSRHFGIDVVLLTQNFRDISSSIASLMAVLIRLRKADILGKSGYIRKVYGGFRGALIETQQREYKPEFFYFYKSHTQGGEVKEASLTDVTPFLVKFNRFKWLWLGLGSIFVIWAFVPKKDQNFLGVKAPDLSSKPSSSSIYVPSPSGSHTPAPKSSPTPSPAPLEPLMGKELHIVGSISTASRKIVALVVSDGTRRLFDLTSDDLTAMGYTFTPLANCSAWLDYKAKRRAITCDAPVFSRGGENRPIVYNETRGISSDPSAPRRESGS